MFSSAPPTAGSGGWRSIAALASKSTASHAQDQRSGFRRIQPTIGRSQTTRPAATRVAQTPKTGRVKAPNSASVSAVHDSAATTRKATAAPASSASGRRLSADASLAGSIRP